MEFLKIIENILNERKYIRLKIYSLEYIIELDNNEYTIYPELYINRKEKYKSLKDLFEKYTIYNENLFDNIKRIKLVEEKEVI